MEDIQQLINQSPEGTTEEQIILLKEKHKGVFGNILSELWNIPEKEPVNPENITVEELAIKNKLTEIREICNAFDEEMDNFLQKAKQHIVK